MKRASGRFACADARAARLFVRLTVCLIFAALFATRADASPLSPLQQLVSILLYLEEEYPEAIEEGAAFEIVEQKRLAQEAVRLVRAERRGEAFIRTIESIRERVMALSDPDGVSADCKRLAGEIAALLSLPTAPAAPVNFARAAQLFQSRCASCHGENGTGDTPFAESLEPRPASFHDSDLMNHLSPYRAFNFINSGIFSTAMPSFYDALSDDERWDLAFYVFTFRQPPSDAEFHLSMQELSVSTDQQLARRYGEDVLAAARHSPNGSPPGALRWLCVASACGVGLVSIASARRALKRREAENPVK